MIEKEKVLETLRDVKVECGDYKVRMGIDRCITAIEQMEEATDDGK